MTVGDLATATFRWPLTLLRGLVGAQRTEAGDPVHHLVGDHAALGVAVLHELHDFFDRRAPSLWWRRKPIVTDDQRDRHHSGTLDRSFHCAAGMVGPSLHRGDDRRDPATMR